jgi:hypothetical protein
MSATATTVTTIDDFKDGPLYKKLIQVLPIFVLDPFSETARFNVQRLIEATGKSHEAVYKWLRSSKLTPDNATMLVGIASSEANVAVLTTLNRPTPTLQDFLPFVFGA